MTLQSTSNYFGVDNIAFGGPAVAVPEPASMTLLGIGGVFCLAAQRLRRRTTRP